MELRPIIINNFYNNIRLDITKLNLKFFHIYTTNILILLVRVFITFLPYYSLVNKPARLNPLKQSLGTKQKLEFYSFYANSLRLDTLQTFP